MKRGTFVLIILSVAACKGGGGAKKRIPDGEKASAALLIKSMEASIGSDWALLGLASGVAEVCGKGCACLDRVTSEEAGDRSTALYECPSVCTKDARARAVAAAPGARLAALTAACTPEGIGLTAESAKQVGEDWLAAYVAGQYLADAYDAANADDKKAYDDAFAKFDVPLVPTAGMAGVSVVGAKNTGAPSKSRVFVAIDAKGGISAGLMHTARFTATGAQHVPTVKKPFTDMNDLDQFLKAAAEGALDPDKLKTAAAGPPPKDDPPPPEAEGPVEDDESGGTGTAMALEEGRMGKKDSVRAEGQYKMKRNSDAPQLARERAIEEARAAGILARPGEAGRFADITGTGDISGGFDEADVYGGLFAPDGDLRSPGTSVLGLASTRIDDQIVVLADRDAPASKLIDVLTRVHGGAVLAVEDKGQLAAFPLVFTNHGLGFAPPPMENGRVVDLVIDVGLANVLVGNTISNEATDIKTGDAAALEAAITTQFKEAVFADRRDVRMKARADATVAQLVPALDAAMSAGARAVRLESFDVGAAGFGNDDGTGWGATDTGRYYGVGTGSGDASGGGVGRSAYKVPEVSIGNPSAVGDLDKNVIRRYIKRNIPKISYCYEKVLLTKPDIQGTVQAQFFITPDGSVATASASGVDPEVASCVADVIKAIEFPKPKGGGGVQVNYPFTFRKADDATPEPKTDQK